MRIDVLYPLNLVLIDMVNSEKYFEMDGPDYDEVYPKNRKKHVSEDEYKSPTILDIILAMSDNENDD